MKSEKEILEELVIVTKRIKELESALKTMNPGEPHLKVAYRISNEMLMVMKERQRVYEWTLGLRE